MEHWKEVRILPRVFEAFDSQRLQECAIPVYEGNFALGALVLRSNVEIPITESRCEGNSDEERSRKDDCDWVAIHFERECIQRFARLSTVKLILVFQWEPLRIGFAFVE